MGNFAFLIHPLDVFDVARKFPIARRLPGRIVEGLLRLMPPMKVSQITGVKTPYGQAEGWFVSCSLTARQMVTLPEKVVYRRIIQTGRKAEQLGAKILGLGAFSSVVGDGGYTVSKHLRIAVTTGNSYTVATAVEGAKEAARLMGYEIKRAHIVILGATGSIGKVCALLLAREATRMTLVARNKRNLEELAAKIFYETGLSVKITDNVKQALGTAQVVIAVTSAVDSIVESQDLISGAVVCDVARPRNVSKQVAKERDDVLVIEGGVVEVPGDVDFHFDFGFPPRMAYACMAETMILALERRYENFSLGREITVERVEEISRLAEKHGFRLAGFRSFERAVSQEEILQIKERVRQRQGELGREP